MVGAIGLFVLAVANGVVSVWLVLHALAQDDLNWTKVVAGLVLGMISAICLSGALVIDGIRNYAQHLSNQIDWILKPGGGGGAAINRERSSGSHGSSLSRFHVVGVDHITGLETELVVQVANETDALRAGEKRGIDVKRVEMVK